MVARDGIGLRVANGICKLQILNGAESARSARMPKRSCKSLAKSIFVFANMAMGKSCLRSEGGGGFGSQVRIIYEVAP
jgi:hypothetical protein